MDTKGITIRSSQYTVKETIDRIQSFLQQKGVTIYARIDQQAEANNAGQKLLPLEFILFGNPKAGGPVMAANPVAALDLPLKVIAWEDHQRKVWVAYNDATYIQERFSLTDAVIAPLNLDPVIENIFKQ
jgi:uncharacterized protein (DUF302 family)